MSPLTFLLTEGEINNNNLNGKDSEEGIDGDARNKVDYSGVRRLKGGSHFPVEGTFMIE